MDLCLNVGVHVESPPLLRRKKDPVCLHASWQYKICPEVVCEEVSISLTGTDQWSPTVR